MDFFCTAYLFSAVEEFYGLTSALAVANNRCLARLGRKLAVLPAFKVRGLSAGSLFEAYKLLQQGKIFFTGPEGEIAWDGRLQPLRPGAAWLALRARAPLVVMVLAGGYDICPRWARRPHVTGRLVLRVGKPFYLCDAPHQRVTEEMLHDANLKIRAEMEALSARYLLDPEKPE
jgi:1-acyl-sn-glycerol-3-phosphate acyltransferase